MHLNNLSDSELKQSLENIQKILPSYQHHFFYNRTLVDPYLLASHGITVSRKRLKSSDQTSVQAVCCDPRCDLTFPFDSHHDIELKEDLESVIRDHDRECSYSKVRHNLICFKLFVRLGRWIFEENLKALTNQKIWIQLNPQQILKVIEVKKEQQGLEAVYGSTLSQLKLLDPSIGEQSLTKVKSSILLAIFGWTWQEKHILSCRFCGATKDVSEYISPLEFSLLKMTEGFSFMDSHHSWCCLVVPLQNYWQQVLRQAVVGELKELQGGASKTWLQLECKNIQRNLLEIFTEHVIWMNTMKKELDSKVMHIQSKMSGVVRSGQQEENELKEKEDPYKKLTVEYGKLGQLLEQQKLSQEGLILNIKAN